MGRRKNNRPWQSENIMIMIMTLGRKQKYFYYKKNTMKLLNCKVIWLRPRINKFQGEVVFESAALWGNITIKLTDKTFYVLTPQMLWKETKQQIKVPQWWHIIISAIHTTRIHIGNIHMSLNDKSEDWTDSNEIDKLAFNLKYKCPIQAPVPPVCKPFYFGHHF